MRKIIFIPAIKLIVANVAGKIVRENMRENTNKIIKIPIRQNSNQKEKDTE